MLSSDYVDRLCYDFLDRKHSRIAYELSQIRYTPTIPMDWNRYYDGLDLRDRYIPISESEDACTFLELVCALAERAFFEEGSSPKEWTRIMLQNCGLWEPKPEGRWTTDDILPIVYKIRMNQYEPNGEGSFFPLQHPKEDMRNVELWYQLQAYLLEKEQMP